MTQTEDERVASDTAELTIEPLFLELRTLAIRGKHLKPGLLRQFLAEDLIETAGPTLRGKPKAWHLFHEKHCAALSPHIHVLWQKGTVYRVALILSNKEQDERYNAKLTAIEQRCFDLCDLLALILAQDHRFDPGPIKEGSDRDGKQRRDLPLGEYTLSLSPNTCFYLRSLEEARRQRDRDAQSIAEPGRVGAIEQAHLLIVHLYDQGIVLGHPTLNSDLLDPTVLSIPLKSYGAEREEDEIGIRWDWRRGYRENGDTAAIESELQTNEQALLAAISDLIVRQRLREVQRAAQSLIHGLGIILEIPKKPRSVLEGGITSLPLEDKLVWKLYEEEDERLSRYPHAWEELYAQLFDLDQIFIDV